MKRLSARTNFIAQLLYHSDFIDDLCLKHPFKELSEPDNTNWMPLFGVFVIQNYSGSNFDSYKSDSEIINSEEV